MSQNELKKNKGKSNFFLTIKGQFVIIGLLAIIGSLIIGNVGISSISKNIRNSRLQSAVNEISILQTKNQANEALYQYYVDQRYLDEILENINQIKEKAAQLEKNGGYTYKSSIQKIKDAVTEIEKNYGQIIELSGKRGFNQGAGAYADFMNAIAQLGDSYGSLINNNDWMEIKWTDANMGMDGKEVTINNKDYVNMVYNCKLPVVVKRDNLIIRVGGTFTYNKKYYIANIKMKNSSGSETIDLSALEYINASGDGLASASITTFNGVPAIEVAAKFDAGNQAWEEAAVTIPIPGYDIEKYDTLIYDIYMEPSEPFGFRYGGSVSGVYPFGSKLGELVNMVSGYSRLVVEGQDVSGYVAAIESLIFEMGENIPKYTTAPQLADISSEKLKIVSDTFYNLKDYDAIIHSLKIRNQELSYELTALCDEIRAEIAVTVEKVRESATTLIIFVFVASAVVLFVITVIVSMGINRNVKEFKSSLDEIADGKIAIRVNQNGHDEFAEFGKSINAFLDNLQESIQRIQEVSAILAKAGNTLEERANSTKGVASIINDALNDISKGAGEQAGDVEDSSNKVIDIRSNIEEIIKSVDRLSKTASNMNDRGNEATTIMQALSDSNDQTTAAFAKIANQIRKTDDSVMKIQEAVNLISSIANQTNLLSLNASIEAARAGEAGKGFAVVASEIQKLAEQTNSSAKIINEIIDMLSDESKQTVQSINEVNVMIDEQKAKLDETKDKFNLVSEGIMATKGEMQVVLGQADNCSKASEQVVSLMTNLSAIAEENAASTEQTTVSMGELNKATFSLTETAKELRSLSDTLNTDLDYFDIG